MAWYPDWVAALHDVATGEPGATVTQDNALEIISEIAKMQKRIRELEQRPRGLQIGDRNTQTNTF